MYVIGIDPGPIPGIVRLQLDVNRPGENLVVNGTFLRGADAMQVTPRLILPVLDMLDEQHDQATTLAVENFVVGRRAAHSSTPAAAATTRTMIGEISGWASGVPSRRTIYTRAAAAVKPWATDKRLHAAGLLDLTAGMRHARDATRHALYCAVRDYGLPDPLSSAYRR